MRYEVGDLILRCPEPKDVEALYQFKNDPEIANLLGGFTTGYSRADLDSWVEHHRQATNEALWTIGRAKDDGCVGHVGLYNIDHRVRRAEFAVLLGDKTLWGQGYGKAITRQVLDYGFEFLNLNRIELSVLAENARALHVYEGLGFKREGTLRQAQFKAGKYLDVVLMAILASERSPANPG